jgi:hypothetical protein
MAVLEEFWTPVAKFTMCDRLYVFSKKLILLTTENKFSALQFHNMERKTPVNFQ